MRIVIFSDIHGNATALEAVLAHMRREAAPDALIVAGDLVAFGPRPAESLALLRGLPEARFVMGNTDLDVLHAASDEAQFTRAHLSSADLTWLEALPFSQRIEAAPGHGLLVVHANPRDLYEAIKPDISAAIVRPMLAGVEQELIAFGHYHVPFVRDIDSHTLVDVASVGMPRDGLARAVYATLTFDGQHWHIAHHRIWFDVQAVANDYTTVGYPDAEKTVRRFLSMSY